MSNYFLIIPAAAFLEDQPTAMSAGNSMPVYCPFYNGWRTDLGIFPDPAQKMVVQGSVVVQTPPTVSVPRFWALWTIAEQDEAEKLRQSGNALASVLFYRIEDRETKEVDLGLYSSEIAQLVNLLAAISPLDKQSRLNKIMAGIPAMLPQETHGQ